jgi:HEAT repeat protein
MPIHPLLTALSAPDLWARLQAECALAEAGRALIPDMLALVGDSSAAVEARWRAIMVLGDLGDADAVDALMTAAADPAWDIRHSAVWSLGMIGDARAFDLLLRVASTGTDEQVPYVAALALGQIDRQRAVTVLGQLQAAPPSEAASRTAHSARVTIDEMTR